MAGPTWCAGGKKIEDRRAELLAMDLEKNDNPELIYEWLSLVAFRSFLMEMAVIDSVYGS